MPPRECMQMTNFMQLGVVKRHNTAWWLYSQTGMHVMQVTDWPTRDVHDIEE